MRAVSHWEYRAQHSDPHHALHPNISAHTNTMSSNFVIHIRRNDVYLFPI